MNSLRDRIASRRFGARVREISAPLCAVFRVEVINLLRRGIFVQGGARRMQKSSIFVV